MRGAQRRLGRQFGLHDFPNIASFRDLAGPIEIRLPCGAHSVWHPSAPGGMIGRTTVLELDGVRRAARIEHAELTEDPRFLLVRLVAID
jgi:hypothetical protein